MLVRFAIDGDREDFKNIRRFAEKFARDMMEVGYMNGKEYDFDDLYEMFTEHIDDALMDGLQDGIDRWDYEKPSEHDEYDEAKEGIILKEMGYDI